MKILHLRTLADSGGGPDKTIFKLCGCLNGKADIRADVGYIVNPMNVDVNRLQRLAESEGIKLFVIEERWPFSINTLRAIKRILQKGRYDIVHSHDYKTHFFSSFLRGHCTYKCVATVHGYNATSFRERLYYQVDRVTLKKVDVVITPGKYLAKFLGRKFGLERVKVIYNGIDLKEWPIRQFDVDKFSNLPFNLLYLGRLSREKNIELLIKALGLLLKETENVRLRIAGTGREHEYLKSFAKSSGLDDYIEFVGFVTREEICELLSSSDILILPSRTEIFPNVLLEAMAVGVPVIASNVGAVNELIRDGRDGLLFDSGDVFQLKEKIRFMMSQPDLACQFVRSARQRIEEEFTFDEHLRKTIELYEN